MVFHAYLAFSSSAYLELGQLAEPMNNLLNMAFSDCATAKMLIKNHLCSEYLLQKGYILRVRDSGAKRAHESKERRLESNKYVLFSLLHPCTSATCNHTWARDLGGVGG